VALDLCQGKMIGPAAARDGRIHTGPAMAGSRGCGGRRDHNGGLSSRAGGATGAAAETRWGSLLLLLLPAATTRSTGLGLLEIPSPGGKIDPPGDGTAEMNEGGEPDRNLKL